MLRALVGVGLSVDPVGRFQGNGQHLIRLNFIEEITLRIIRHKKLKKIYSRLRVYEGKLLKNGYTHENKKLIVFRKRPLKHW